MKREVSEAIAAIGKGPLREELIQLHVVPLFSRVLARGSSYLANHSLGRPLDVMAEDVAEATGLWYGMMDKAWDAWLAEQEAFRVRIATLIGAPSATCVVPKTSAGQGLRTVLNALPGTPRVVTTRGEFDSIDVILKQYAMLEQIAIRWIEPDRRGEFHLEALIDAVRAGTDLVVVSQTMFMTGQILSDLNDLAEACHRNGALLLVDSYHAIGVIPVDVGHMNADFMIGGSYKYLRGGPGACFLYISPQALEKELRPLDIGWFANTNSFAYRRPDPPVLKTGGNAFLESTPPVLPYYQARSGQEFVLAMGVERLRAYSLAQLRCLRTYLQQEGITDLVGGDEKHGAFLAINSKMAPQIAIKLERKGIHCDARGEWLRFCPDCLTREEELQNAAATLGRVLREHRAILGTRHAH
jgi:kynureninase